MKDAFGGELVIGDLYAYTRNSSGITHSIKGILIKVTAKGNATLLVQKRFAALYLYDAVEKEIDRKKVSCKCNSIIPIKL